MNRKPITSNLVGHQLAGLSFSWTAKDTILYALGVGATPLRSLDFIYEGRGPKVLPTFAVIPGSLAMGAAMREIDMRLEMLLHGEQSVELARVLPASGTVEITGRITEVWDKGKAAIIGIESVASDKEGELFRTRATLFVRGAGGFGGERGSSTPNLALPNREADIVEHFETRPEQGAIYRLSGDLNPIHIDPQFAKMGGFDAPFMHGLCTYGIVGRAFLHNLCHDDPALFRSLEGRFAERVAYGDIITTRIWKTGKGEALIQAQAQDGRVVLSNARASYKE
ncbi:MAG: MaoC family dehydratase N-terminal domain-containing protein [Proteobacteria bacterium]|jgi:acyl dehydratase|nr:MaoC family dehydratase N-terminal domain-containing protein [Pseudomonadota bacterium]